MNVFTAFRSKSIRARFFTTLLANLIRFALGFLSGMFIARALGPADFGNFNFLLTSFASISQLLDMGTSSAFYTFISRKKRASNFYFYYISWIALQFVIALLLVTVLVPDVLRQKIWLGHGRDIVVLSLLASFSMNQLWQVASHAGESIRSTVTVQVFNIVVSAVHILAVLLMIKMGIITVSNLFIFIAVEYVVFAVMLSRKLKDTLFEPGIKEEAKDIFKEFKAYCYPLIVLVWVGFLYMFADNWLLQRFGGAVEQGYYAIGFRFTFLSAIATASMLQVFWKEIAEDMDRGDLEAVQGLYLKVSRVLYFVSASLSCLLIPFSRELLVWLLGPSYEGAWLCLSIMLLFPLIQAVGQVASTVLLAGGHTTVYRNFGVVYMLLSIPITYFILATPDGRIFGIWIPGLGLGSTGLALKTVVLNYIGTNIVIYIVSRLYRWKFDFWYQIAVAGILLPIGFISKTVVQWLLGAVLVSVSIPTLLFSSMFLYSAGVAVLIYTLPSLTGLKRDEIKSLLDRAKAILSEQEAAK